MAAKLIQIFISIAEKRQYLLVEEDDPVNKVVTLVQKKFMTEVDYKEIELVYENRTLNHECRETLNVQQGSLLTVVGLVRGGMPRERDIWQKELSLKPLPGWIEVTSEEDKPDIITYEDGDFPKRAVMPCGHAISPRSMTQYCDSVVKANKNEIVCPACRQPWPWHLVRYVACFTSEEWSDIEARVGATTLIKNGLYRQCPGCQMWLKRTKELTEVFNCKSCSMRSGRAYNFCWNCLHVTGERTNECPQKCVARTKSSKELSTCTEKLIGSTMCFSVRSCPNCRILIEHVGGCKHMDCKSCDVEFCFICLRFGQRGKLFDDHLKDSCILAPRQQR